MQPTMQPLGGMLVVDFSRYLPGAFASRELLELFDADEVCVGPVATVAEAAADLA